MFVGRTFVTLLVAACCVLLAGCAADADGAAGPAETGIAPATEWTGADMSAVISMSYEVTTALWDDEGRFPLSDDEFDALAGAVAARMIDTVEEPVEDGRWSVTVHRGSYEGAGLGACSDGALEVRIVITRDGEAIGIGVADSTDVGRLIYDRTMTGVDPAFDVDGIASSASSCTWTGNELAGAEVASRQGVFG